MKLSKISQIKDLNSFLSATDVMICGCGYEERSVSLVLREEENVSRIKYKLALAYTMPDDDRLRGHRTIYMDKGFEMHDITGNEKLREQIDFFTAYFESIDETSQINVVFDYSSISREWYGAFILFLEIYQPACCSYVNSFFYYSIPNYPGHGDEKFSISDIKPLYGFSSLSFPDKPMTMVVGLGAEDQVLKGIQQFSDIDPSYIHYYYTKNDHIFLPVNKYANLFQNIEDSHKHEYSLDNMIKLFNSLCDLYRSIEGSSRMVVVSCGPKPFTLMSLFFARLYGVDVWKLHNNLSDHYVAKEASGEYVIIHFEYRQNHSSKMNDVSSPQ